MTAMPIILGGGNEPVTPQEEHLRVNDSGQSHFYHIISDNDTSKEHYFKNQSQISITNNTPYIYEDLKVVPVVKYNGKELTEADGLYLSDNKPQSFNPGFRTQYFYTTYTGEPIAQADISLKLESSNRETETIEMGKISFIPYVIISKIEGDELHNVSKDIPMEMTADTETNFIFTKVLYSTGSSSMGFSLKIDQDNNTVSEFIYGTDNITAGGKEYVPCKKATHEGIEIDNTIVMASNPISCYASIKTSSNASSGSNDTYNFGILRSDQTSENSPRGAKPIGISINIK